MRTEDRLLDGRVRLRQPKDGYRVAIDPVMLAAAVPAKRGERILDAGCGVGAASLCLLARVPGCDVTGIDVDAATVAQAAENAAINGFHASRFHAGDLAGGWTAAGLTAFDQVMTNPPFGDPGKGNASPITDKRRAHMGIGVTLQQWIGFCLDALKPKGRLTLVYPAERLDALLAELRGRAGTVTVFPLWPKADRPAKRVIVSARKGTRAPLYLAPGMVLHREDGAFTPEAEGILRKAAPLDLSGRKG